MVGVDALLTTLTKLDPFDSAALEAAINDALNKVVDDGKIGDYGVDPEGAVEIANPELGMIINCPIFTNITAKNFQHFYYLSSFFL